ncbi:MAG: choice-of-anchor V domain-containing protein [Acidobacteriota bacterium]
MVTAGATQHLRAWSRSPPPARVNYCGFGPSCADIGCHPLLSASPTLEVELTMEDGSDRPSVWIPGESYDLRITATDPDAFHLGFQVFPSMNCPFLEPAGELVVTDTARTEISTALNGYQYLAHLCTCEVTRTPDCCGIALPSFDPPMNSWPFRWIAPARGSGTIDFFMGFNSANGDSENTDDFISHRWFVWDEEPCPPRVDDLRLRLTECGMPGEQRLELSWTPQGPDATVLREATGLTQLADPKPSWDLLTDGACRPLDARPLVYYSVTDTCAMGGEGFH